MKKSIIVFFLIIPCLICYCTLEIPDDPKAPTWDIKIEKIPLLKADTLRIGDELDKKDFNRSGPDSVLSVAIDNSKNFYIGDKLKIPHQNESFSDQIGEFKIQATQSVSHDININELYPTNSYPELTEAMAHGTPVVIPAVDVTDVNKETKFDEYTEVSVVSGGFEINIYNHLGFPLGDAVYLNLYDVQFDRSIDQINFGTIQNLQDSTYYLDLSNQTISGNLETRIVGRLSGSNNELVTIDQTAGFQIIVTPKDIVANRAVAQLPQQSFHLEGEVDINQDTLFINSAKIESGSILISVNNKFQFGIGLDITIPNLFDANYQLVSGDLHVPAGNTDVLYIDLKNTTIDLDNKNLIFNTLMSIFPDQNTHYTVESGDELTVNVTIGDIQFAEVTGDFNIRAAFPEINEDVFDDPPDEFENLEFNNAILTLAFPNSPFDETELDIVITADKDNSTPAALTIKRTLQKNEALILDKNGINNDGSGPTIVDILNMIPETISIEGKARVIGDNITFRKDDSLQVDYDIELPLAFSLNGAMYTNVDSLDMDDDARDNIRDYLKEASIELTIENGIPVSGNLSFLVGSDSNTVMNTLFTVSIPTPMVNGNGIVESPGIGTPSIALSEEKFQTLADAKWYKYEVALDSTDLAQLTANDFIIVRDVYISGKMRIDPEGMSDDEK